jgi:hypothetical protein
MERRNFTREFKREAVRLIKDRGVSYVQASQDWACIRRSCAILISTVGTSIWGSQARAGWLRPDSRTRSVWHRTRRTP